MTIDIGQTAAAVVTTLAPFTPFLIEVIAQKGGEAAWKKAQALWDKLKARFEDDPEVKSAATMVAAKPEDEARQTMLAEVLGARLQENPALAQELFDLLGGREAVQQVLADRGSWVEDVTQRMKGGGKQIVQASDDSVIKGVRQIK
jgi:glycine/D-amino acid oxidase-like deaminating enzyme